MNKKSLSATNRLELVHDSLLDDLQELHSLLQEAKEKHRRAGQCILVGGLAWGDEGKGKGLDAILDEIFQTSPDREVWVVRFNGGHNAGHTLVSQSGVEISLHLVPSGVSHPKAKLYIGEGTIVNPVKLVRQELEDIKRVGYSVENRLKISQLATLVLPHEILLDQLAGQVIGTTGNAIGTAVADKAMRNRDGLTTSLNLVQALADPSRTRQIIVENYHTMLKSNEDLCRKYPQIILKFEQNGGIERAADEFMACLQEIVDRDFVETNIHLMKERLDAGALVVGETAQGVMLDSLKGPRPGVTSTPTLPIYATIGAGIPHEYIKQIIGVTKMPPSRVGNGPFPTEIGGEEGEKYRALLSQDPINLSELTPYLQKLRPFFKPEFQDYDWLENLNRKDEKGKPLLSVQQFEDRLDQQKLLESGDCFLAEIALRQSLNEYGATTKRPRGVGFIDLFQLAHACKLANITGLWLNRLDALPLFKKIGGEQGIPLVTGYKNKITGAVCQTYPLTEEELRATEPIIEYLDFPDTALNFTNIQTKEDLPPVVQDFMNAVKDKISQLVGKSIDLRGVGIGRRTKDIVSMPPQPKVRVVIE